MCQDSRDAHHHSCSQLPPGPQDEGGQHPDAAHELEETPQLPSHVRGGGLNDVDGGRGEDKPQSNSTREPTSSIY